MLSFFHKKLEQIQRWLQSNAVFSVQQSLGKLDIKKNASLRVLCIDADTTSCQSIKKMANPYHIQVEIAYSINETKEKIQKLPPFDAFIIDAHLPDGLGVDLISWIREQGIESPIAFVSKIYKDAADFQILRETFQVNYVLERPLTSQKMDELFRQLYLAKEQQVGEESLNLEETTLVKLPCQEKSNEKLTSILTERPAIYLIHADKEWLEQVERYFSKKNIKILTDFDLTKAMERLASANFIPKTLIINSRYPQHHLTGYDLLEIFNKKKKGALTTEIGIIVDDFNEMSEILKKEINNILLSSLPLDHFNRILEGIQNKLPNIKILFIGEDVDLCKYIDYHLKEIGFEIYCSASEILNVLMSYYPDLVFIHVDLLNRYRELFDQLAQDERFRHLIMIGLVNEKDLQAIEEMKSCPFVREILYLPLNSSELQTKILQIVKNYNRYLPASDLDPVTGLFDRASFTQFLSHQFIQSTEHPLLSALVQFEIEALQDERQYLGKQKYEQTLRITGQFLLQELKRWKVNACIREGVFSILFCGMDLYFISFIMKDFLKRLQGKLSDTLSLLTFFNCGIAFLPDGFTNVDQLMRKAERALQYARQQREEEIKIAALPEDVECFKKRELAIRSEHTPSSLKTLFSQQSFSIMELTGRKSMINYIAHLSHKHMFPLIVATQFGQKDKLELLNYLRNYYQLQIPLIALPLSEEHLLKNELQHDSLNFFSRPFSLIILLAE